MSKAVSKARQCELDFTRVAPSAYLSASRSSSGDEVHRLGGVEVLGQRDREPVLAQLVDEPREQLKHGGGAASVAAR